jgi:hypothetical protein
MTPEVYDKYKEFLTWFGDLYMATKPPLCKAEQIETLVEIIEPGDVLMRGYNYYLDSYFIPGEYTHSGVVINKREVIHSIAEGVQSIHPIDFIKDTDRFILLRPRYVPNLIHNVVSRAIWHCEANKTQYDFTFKEDGKFYCHEFTADCLAAAGLIVSQTRKVFGVWPFKFERVLYLADNFREVCFVVYEFNPGGD